MAIKGGKQMSELNCEGCKWKDSKVEHFNYCLNCNRYYPKDYFKPAKPTPPKLPTLVREEGDISVWPYPYPYFAEKLDSLIDYLAYKEKEGQK